MHFGNLAIRVGVAESVAHERRQPLGSAGRREQTRREGIAQPVGRRDSPVSRGDHRGQYAEKNSNWMPYTSFLDLSIRQDLGLHLGNSTHRLQLSLDVFNLPNLISSDWGVRYSVPGNFNNFYLYNFIGYETSDNTTPRFNYTYGDRTGKDAFNINDLSSRWQMRLGVRYIFN